MYFLIKKHTHKKTIFFIIFLNSIYVKAIQTAVLIRKRCTKSPEALPKNSITCLRKKPNPPSHQFHNETYRFKNYPLNLKCDFTPKKSIHFLDTSCEIMNGKLKIDLYMKNTDRNQYLLPSSCHPMQIKTNIPFSLCLRILEVCTNKSDKKGCKILNSVYSPENTQ